MSRSRRKSPWMGVTCADSEKWDKRFANRKLRKKVKQQLSQFTEGDDELLFPKLREVSEEWMFAKDGRQRINDDKYLRK